MVQLLLVHMMIFLKLCKFAKSIVFGLIWMLLMQALLGFVQNTEKIDCF